MGRKCETSSWTKPLPTYPQTKSCSVKLQKLSPIDMDKIIKTNKKPQHTSPPATHKSPEPLITTPEPSASAPPTSKSQPN